MSLIFDILKKEKYLSKYKIAMLKEKQEAQKTGLVVEEDVISEKKLIQVLSKNLHIPVISLNKDMVNPTALKIVPYKIAKRYGVCPVTIKDSFLVVAISNPFDIVSLDEIRFCANMPIKSVLSTKGEIETCIEQAYQQLQNTISELELIDNIEFARTTCYPEGEEPQDVCTPFER